MTKSELMDYVNCVENINYCGCEVDLEELRNIIENGLSDTDDYELETLILLTVLDEEELEDWIDNYA